MSSKKIRILVIDDSEVILSRIKRTLEAEGFEVTTTAQAVGNARRIPTSDLVIIDYHMPGLDGGTVMSSLRSAATAMNHSCLFYLYTSDKTMAASYARLGFDGCFTDKGNDAALVRQIHAAMRILQIQRLGAGMRPSARPPPNK